MNIIEKALIVLLTASALFALTGSSAHTLFSNMNRGLMTTTHQAFKVAE